MPSDPVRYEDDVLGQRDVAHSLSVVLPSGGAPAGVVEVVQPAHDDLNCNANVQVGNADVSLTNPLPSVERVLRSVSTIHRINIATHDKIADMTNALLATADNGPVTGSLNFNTTYYITVIPGNPYGCTKVATVINSQATAADAQATHSIRVTIPLVLGATWYDVFLSTDAAPKWVGRINEVERAAGDYEITAVGTVVAGGGNPAGTVDVNVVGTGQQTSSGTFAQNNAYRPDAVAAVGFVACTGRKKAYLYIALDVTDLRSVPALTIVVFLQADGGTWYQANAEKVNMLNDLGQSMEQVFCLDVDGSLGLVVLVDTISGQGAAVFVSVELV